ncbi:MAG TPA: family 43 glycosylhydrolase [Puia sp.]|nr:family 43 glycosylhydrolase [Puia sp.]
MKMILQGLFLFVLLWQECPAQEAVRAEGIVRNSNAGANRNYISNRAPLLKDHFAKLPVTAFKPGGWLKKQLELQRDGLTGHLGEISIWLSKKDNAWLNKEGKGKWGWEELPYWLKGYANIGYMLRDEKIIKEATFWINTVLNGQRADGDFGPMVEHKGKRDLWTNMPMLWCLQSWYEYSGDRRVLPFMARYFKWELSLPDSMFLKDYWENSRGGDNLYSVYWLYNRSPEPWLLDLATKIDRNTANWRQKDNLPNWHNVNIAQSFREPAEYYMQTHSQTDLDATYNDFSLVRQRYGHVPGGLFGADENARKGYDDPRQATETCGMVEQMTSDQMLLRSTGDTRWAENCEDIAFNTFPAAFMPDYRSLRYLTAPNMVVSDSRNHSPGIDNSGPFLMMNPFSSRCCQHNHAAGWVYYAENCWMATPDNGLAAQLYSDGVLTAKVADGTTVTVTEKTRYPFEGTITFEVKAVRPVGFPLYLRIPAWCKAPVVRVNGAAIMVTAAPGGYLRLEKIWKDGDQISLELPMELAVRKWTNNKNSISLNYGPLTFSLKIAEQYVKKNSRETAQGDSKWQEDADTENWPSFEIYPASAWNYGLVLDEDLLHSFSVIRKPWPADDNPFVNSGAPIEIRAKGRKIPSWTIDQYGLCAVLPQSPVATDEATEELILVPMGGARLRISAFPVVAAQGTASSAALADPQEQTFVNPVLPSGPDPYSFYKDGYYYYTNTMGDRLVLWKSASIARLRTAESRTIFVPPTGTPWSKDLWAPEVLFIGDKWYAYFAADGGNNHGHRLYVLENASPDPMKGEWVFKGKIADPSDKWAIDGDVFSYKGQWYITWSGWEDDRNWQQNIYIAKMKNPWTIEGGRSLISSPIFGWEQKGDLHHAGDPPHIDVNEGPQALLHKDKLFIVYSASACWTDDYALGLLTFTGGDDPTDPSKWKKSTEPVFKQSPANGVYATGHNSFFKSPHGEDWILYHANSQPGQGCGKSRSPRAQRFTWNEDGSPHFGEPVKEGVAITIPN